MKKFKFKKINAFAKNKSDGNPVGMVYLDPSDKISEDEMLKLAFQLKGFVSEIGYIKKINDNTFDLKYYSSEREVDFCGHATIAIMYDLIKNDNELMDKNNVNIMTKKGKLLVENRIKKEDAVFITAPDPVVSSKKISPNDVAQALGILKNDLNSTYPISILNAGLETLIVPIKTLDCTLAIKPTFEVLRRFCFKNKIDIVTIFTDQVADPENRFRTRVFAPTFGYLEDPATGSGNSALGYYLLQNGLWENDFLSIEQNTSRENPNIIKLMRRNNDNNMPQITFGGGAVVKIEGMYFL